MNIKHHNHIQHHKTISLSVEIHLNIFAACKNMWILSSHGILVKHGNMIHKSMVSQWSWSLGVWHQTQSPYIKDSYCPQAWHMLWHFLLYVLLAWGPVIFKTFIQIHQLRHGQPCLYLYISKQLVNSAIHESMSNMISHHLVTWMFTRIGSFTGFDFVLGMISLPCCSGSWRYYYGPVYLFWHDVVPCAPFFGKQVAPEILGSSGEF